MGISDPSVRRPKPNPEHPEIDLVRILDGCVEYIRKYVSMSEEQSDASALWVAHSHAVDAAEATPYLSIRSAEKQSGKTRLLECLDVVVARPWLTGRVTSAVLVRKVDQDSPTLLLDESDAAFRGDKEYAETLRGLLNAGYKRNGRASLCVRVGKDFAVKDFSVFCPKAIAGIGELPDTVSDRSIPIILRRKSASEHVIRFRSRDATEAGLPIREDLERWADVSVPLLEQSRPTIPPELGDRAADVWEPLLAIADLAGEAWPDRARAAAVALSGDGSNEDISPGVSLLNDIREVFVEMSSDRMPSASLVSALIGKEECPWGDLKGKPLDARSLARLLKPFDIRPHGLRLEDRTTPKGYYIRDFADAWSRYLPASATSATGNEAGHKSVADVAVDNGYRG